MKERNSSLDILRLISMLMIVTMHVLTIGNLLNSNGNVKDLNYLWGSFLNTFCLGAVNIFVLISGYFGKGYGYRIRNIMRIWGSALFYSVGIFLIFLFFDKHSLSEGLYFLFPTISSEYWFLTAYLALVAISPLLNAASDVLSQIQLRSILCVLIFLFVVLQTIIKEDIFFTNYGYSAFFFALLYLIAQYYAKYGTSLLGGGFDFDWKVYVLLYSITSCLGFFTYVTDCGGFKMVVTRYTSITTFCSAIFLFRAFTKMKFNLGSKKGGVFLSEVSRLVFSVYLIHMHPIIREKCLENRFAQYQAARPIVYIALSLIIPVIVMIICMLIDIIRYLIFKQIGNTKLFSERFH